MHESDRIERQEKEPRTMPHDQGKVLDCKTLQAMIRVRNRKRAEFYAAQRS